AEGAKAATAKTDSEKAKGRLPNNFGKVGLSEEQTQKIYGIQNKYNGDIDKLEAQIAQMKTQRDQEVLAVLSPDQKSKLDEFTAATNKKKAEGKAKPKEEKKE